MIPRNADGEIIESRIDYLETWKGMEECVRQGLTRSIGISNFNSEQIARLLESAEIAPVNNQVRHIESFKLFRDVVARSSSRDSHASRIASRRNRPIKRNVLLGRSQRKRQSGETDRFLQETQYHRNGLLSLGTTGKSIKDRKQIG